MASNIYPLLYKPGIKRDGSLNQSEYCTDGQWVRFQRGNIRKIGGMKGFGFETGAASVTVDSSSICMIPSSNSKLILYSYIAVGNDIIHMYRMVFNPDLTLSIVPLFLQIPARIKKTVVQFETIIQSNNKFLVCLLGSNTLEDINSDDQCNIWHIKIDTAAETDTVINLQNPPNLMGLSGLLFVANYLFVYGSNGKVQWSKPNNPLDFSNPGTREITISNDKVICAKSIRGGINNPAILFWTMSSVVRCINNPASNAPPDTLQFQRDVLSKSSSILSSRCVVEYDGKFFWPGVNRFFQYNGIVDELPNKMNLNYFFDNIDMAHRQSVFGVVNSQYGEIWWFYPEKSGTPGRINVPLGQNSRALIYNVREDSWYDTAISRAHGVHVAEYGAMFTYGKALSVSNIYAYLFKHDDNSGSTNYAVRETATGYQNNIPTFSNPINSNFTTPLISWATFNAMKQFTGVNRWVNLIRIEPDFTLMPTRDIGGDMRLMVNTKEYLQNVFQSFGPYSIPAPLIPGTATIFGKVDIAQQGRYINLTFSTTFNFEMGQVMLELGIGDGQ